MSKTKDLQKLINRRFGEGTMLFASDPSLEIKRIPTGILSIDWVLGGGIARGRHSEIFGSYSVGKTYTSYRLIASAQSLGLQCCFIDVERTFDKQFAEKAGINLKQLALHRQRSGNRVVDFMETLLRAGDYGVIVLDSIAALLPKAELDTDMEAGSYGTQQAKLMSAALRRLTAANSNTALVYINQTRDAIGYFFGSRSVTSGGRAMAFYAGTRLEMSMAEKIKRKSKVVDPKTSAVKQKDVIKGHRVTVRLDKDKTGGLPSQSLSTFVFDYDLQGIDPIEDLLYVGRQVGLVKKKGNRFWVSGFKEEAQIGRSHFKSWLGRNKAVGEDLEQRIREAIESDES